MGWFSSKKKRPDAKDVAIRAIVLRHVVSYAFITPTRDTLKQAALWWTAEEKKNFSRDAVKTRDEHWATLDNFRKYLSPLEASYSRTTRETMTEAQLINATWRVEALTAILWSLGKIEQIPPYDVQTDPNVFGDFAKEKADEFVSNAELRPAEEIDKARDIAESWHWRSRTRQLIEDGTSFPSDPNFATAGFYAFDDIVRATAKMNADDGAFGALIDEDYAAFAKAYRDLSDEEWSIIRSITMERHFTLNWLCGYALGHRWDETPTDT